MFVKVHPSEVSQGEKIRVVESKEDAVISHSFLVKEVKSNKSSDYFIIYGDHVSIEIDVKSDDGWVTEVYVERYVE